MLVSAIGTIASAVVWVLTFWFVARRLQGPNDLGTDTC